MKSCRTCAWYCHSDGKCYGNHGILFGREFGVALDVRKSCGDYQYDGLEDWEREEIER